MEQKKFKVLERPLSNEEIAAQLVANGNPIEGFISGVVSINLSDVIDNDLEGFLDILSNSLIGNECLMDIDYKVVGVGTQPNEENVLFVEVSGYLWDVEKHINEDMIDEIMSLLV